MNRKLQRVEEVIKMLHMEKCADTVVGDAGARGVSGGEKKRLCIGMELLTEPKFLFFDEPTSGLDSSHALLVAKCMRDLCRSGVTVISSIHQPSSQIFELFDDLLLLDEGNVAYFGPQADSVSFFSSLGFDCPISWNPADFFMDLLVLEDKQVRAIFNTCIYSPSFPWFSLLLQVPATICPRLRCVRSSATSLPRSASSTHRRTRTLRQPQRAA
jgi:ABC-type multidrug transport system ATPase subunit